MTIAALFVLAAAGIAVDPACQPVDGEHILGRDLAVAEPRLTIPDPNQDVGFAPEPGAKRVFWPAELLQIARKNGVVVEDTLHQLCFERRTRVLPESEILAAVHTWAPESAQVTLVEQSKFPAPAGTLVLPRPAVIHSAPDGSVLLRGYVLFGSDHRFPIWARLQFRVDRKVTVATEDIAAGSEIRADQLTMDQRSGGIEALQNATDPAQVAGRITVRRVVAGDPIALASLLKPKQVNSGAIVRVEVINGATHLLLDGRAETGGRTGDMIMIRNPSSGKAFQARITGDDAAVVMPRGMHLEGKNAN